MCFLSQIFMKMINFKNMTVRIRQQFKNMTIRKKTNFLKYDRWDKTNIL